MKWLNPTLGDIATIVGGSTPSRNREEYWNGSIPWLTPTDLPMPGEGIGEVSDTASKITEEGLAAISAQLLPVGTVLFSSRATIGKIGISRVPLATNQGFANFIPRNGVDEKYLAYCLLNFRHQIAVLAGSTTFKEVTKTSLKKYKIPLPPFSEQRRIVEILDQADALRKKCAEADAKATRILPALFYKMFGDPAMDIKQEFRSLADCADIFMGQSPPGETYNREGDGLPFFQGKSEFGLVNPTVRQWCSSPTRIAEPGDVLLCVRAPVGPTNVADKKCAIGRGLAAIRPIPNRSTTEFLFYSLRAIEKEVAKIAQGSTFTAIRRQDVERIMVPKARVEDQAAFSAKARTIQELLDKGTALTTIIKKLFTILLHRAFTGDLTARWREVHMKELLQEMEQQAKALGIKDP